MTDDKATGRRCAWRRSVLLGAATGTAVDGFLG
jgi:hypothetical protein